MANARPENGAERGQARDHTILSSLSGLAALFRGVYPALKRWAILSRPGRAKTLYGTLQFPERNVYCLAGFADKALQTMRFLEEDKSALLREIEAIEL